MKNLLDALESNRGLVLHPQNNHKTDYRSIRTLFSSTSRRDFTGKRIHCTKLHSIIALTNPDFRRESKRTRTQMAFKLRKFCFSIDPPCEIGMKTKRCWLVGWMESVSRTLHYRLAKQKQKLREHWLSHLGNRCCLRAGTRWEIIGLTVR